MEDAPQRLSQGGRVIREPSGGDADRANASAPGVVHIGRAAGATNEDAGADRVGGSGEQACGIAHPDTGRRAGPAAAADELDPALLRQLGDVGGVAVAASADAE